ncbi:MAG: hypothetical protein JRF33_21005 [Deltaproteobacteria bacterium]|nr:hypothetical protein [Deltaproteobacteria bacterium]
MLARILMALGGLVALALLGLAAYRFIFSFQSSSRFEQLGMKANADGLERFKLEMLDGLPEPAKRYLSHAMQSGSPLFDRVEFSGHGSIRLEEKWQTFDFEERLAAHRGFVWQAGLNEMQVYTDDFYLNRAGGVNVFLFYLFPMVRSSGPDIARSASHRFAIEHVWLPTALLPGRQVRWEPVDENRARVIIRTDLEEDVPITLTIDEQGKVIKVSMKRWSQVTVDAPWSLTPYEGFVEEESTFDGITIPSKIRIGYGQGDDWKSGFFCEVRAAKYID